MGHQGTDCQVRRRAPVKPAAWSLPGAAQEHFLLCWRSTDIGLSGTYQAQAQSSSI